MKKTTKIFLVIGLAATIASCGNKAGTTDNKTEAIDSTATDNVLNDGLNAKTVRVENLHLTRFIEIFLATPDPATGKLVAPCYNTMFSPDGIPASKNTAPQELVEGLDLEKIKKEFGVKGASLNGPKLWTPDYTDIEMGVVREFNGIKAGWVAQLNMGDNAGGVSETTPYKPVTIARKSELGWKKGTTVLLLDDTEGNTYVLKGFQLGVKPRISYEEFVELVTAIIKISQQAGSLGLKRLKVI